MPSRRELKKNVNYIIGELFAECLINSLSSKEESQQKADDILSNILNIQDEFVSRINHTEKGNEKTFYKKFRKDFNEQINVLIDEISNLN